ncbi:MAG: GNAT family N-acetyltransferase [Terriglobia bacterium]
MKILPFKSSDFETLYKIDQECFPPGISYSRDELNRFIRHRLAKTWVAHSENKIVGFLVLGREPQKVGHIVTIDVVEGQRGTGVGKALMKTAEDWAHREGLGILYLETAENNRAAQNFYTAHGYAKVEEIPNYYPNQTAAWVMVKWL